MMAVALVNHVEGLGDFLRRWDSGEEILCDPAVGSNVGTAGEINETGSPDCLSARLLTKWHPGFERVVEPGVLALVKALVWAWDAITYSSCAGHAAHGRAELRPCHVGIVPRDAKERAQLAAALNTLIAASASCGVRGKLLPRRLTSEDGDLEVLDLMLEPALDETTYFEQLPLVCQRLARAVTILTDLLPGGLERSPAMHEHVGL